jgi:hypothetical protein
MARKVSKRQNASTSAKTGQRNAGARSSHAFYGDMLGIVGSLLRSRQAAGAEKISSLAVVARNFANDLADIPNIKTYVTGAAEQMENLSDYVTESSFEEMVDDATQLAKRYPVATAVVAAAVGFGFTRLMTHNGRATAATNQKSTRRSSGARIAKASATKKRSSVTRKTRANGKDTSNASTHAS